mmetsp:Transcript_3332/g.5895  ORF Transcript_3332/g.5895 Transcript_3332/m.5895 type:complete len:109 (-) Transcript_3332:75-401(-)
MTRVSTLTHFLLVAVLMHHGQSLHTPLVRNAANASVPPLRNASVPPLEEKQLRNSTLDDSRSSIASMIEEEEEEKEEEEDVEYTVEDFEKDLEHDQGDATYDMAASDE